MRDNYVKYRHKHGERITRAEERRARLRRIKAGALFTMQHDLEIINMFPESADPAWVARVNKAFERACARLSELDWNPEGETS